MLKPDSGNRSITPERHLSGLLPYDSYPTSLPDRLPDRPSACLPASLPPHIAEQGDHGDIIEN